MNESKDYKVLETRCPLLTISGLPKTGFFIYAIENTINSSVYIGSSTNIHNRWNVHHCRLVTNSHHNPPLQQAWNKYGSENFAWHILNNLDGKKAMLPAEQATLDFFRLHVSIYNIATCVLPNHKAGYTISDEGRRRMSRAQKGKTLSQAHKDKIAKGYPQLRNLSTGEIIPAGHNITTVCKTHNLKPPGIHRLVCGKNYSSQGWIVDGTKRPQAHDAKPYPSLINIRTGEIVPAGMNLTKFSKERELTPTNMWAVVRGRKWTKSYMGWRIYENRE